jgi:hypothetical protein
LSIITIFIINDKGYKPYSTIGKRNNSPKLNPLSKSTEPMEKHSGGARPLT